MKLKNVFGKPEKVEPEKQLEVITTEESVLDDLIAYFEKLFPPHLLTYKEAFDACRKDLRSYPIKPELIKKFNEKINLTSFDPYKRCCRGVFVSSLIQVSYDQGLNNFEFGKINFDSFGEFLEGQKNKPIKIKVNTTNEKDTLWAAKYCNLTAEIINGNRTLWYAQNCIAEIQSYKGEEFGKGMENCTIYSPNQEVLEKIKRQIEQGFGMSNSFHLGKLPTK
ncbi:hypothetical protein HY643_05070 [Candidatus Woesearchaeota archaeon]|nr:hypothetical protein [Candidatus Woesearchaeota archaeon]